VKKREHHHSWAFLSWFEWFTDIIIPYLLIILAIELLIENPLWVLYDLEQWHAITYLDYAILFFFIVDLSFKWWHVKNLTQFVKLYWLDILAVLPFYLGFRVYARFAGLLSTGEEIAAMQKVAHEAVLTREAQLADDLGKLARDEKFLREARPLTRFVQTMERSLRIVSGRQDVGHQGMKHAILKSEH
jgi:hypothetical protein